MTVETRRSRRSVLAGAAWTTPVVLGVSVAPALAASPCTSPVRTPSAANGWTTVSSNMQNNGSNGFNGTGYALSSDPATGPATVTVTSPSFSFDSARTYTFSYNYSLVSINPRVLNLDVRYAGISLPTLAINTDTTLPATGTKTASFVAPPGTSGSIVFAFSFPAIPGNNGGDDITMTNFAVTCA